MVVVVFFCFLFFYNAVLSRKRKFYLSNSWNIFFHLHQMSANKGPWAEPSSCVFANKVWLEHGHAHLLTHCLCLPLCCNCRVFVDTESIVPNISYWVLYRPSLLTSDLENKSSISWQGSPWVGLGDQEASVRVMHLPCTWSRQFGIFASSTLSRSFNFLFYCSLLSHFWVKW